LRKPFRHYQSGLNPDYWLHLNTFLEPGALESFLKALPPKQAKILINKHKTLIKLQSYLKSHRILTKLEKRIKNYFESAIGYNDKINKEEDTFYLVFDKKLKLKDIKEYPDNYTTKSFDLKDKLEAKSYAKKNKLRCIKIRI